MGGKHAIGESLWHVWARTLRKRREHIVLIDAPTGRSWTAQALNDAVCTWADRLAPYRSGERIAFRLPNGLEWLSLFLAVQRADLIAAPLDATLPVEGCHAIARRLGASALYLDGEFHPVGKPGRRRPGLSCLKMTSGTGALPKIIECRAAHLLADGRNIITTMKLRPDDRHLAVIPLGHSYGLGNLVLPLIRQGATLVCATDYVPRQLVEWMERYQITVFPGVPALFRVLAALPPGPPSPLVRTVISAGAPLAPSIAQAYHARYGIKIHNFYGSSETGGICYDRTGRASLEGKSVGRPLAGVSVTFSAGQIVVAGEAVAARAGRYRLADHGEWNGRGELVLLGRSGAGANIGGKKVHPREIERALRSLPGVTDAAVWLQPGQGRDLLLAAVETRRPRAEIEQALAAHLPAWKLPKDYLLRAEFPRTSRGKIDLATLKGQMRIG